MLIDIDKIVVGDRIRKDFGDIQELAEDIKENGLINPPTVNKEYVLLAGERRLRACKSLGWTQIEVHMLDTKDEAHDLAVEMSENNMRRNFTGSELAEGIRRQMAIESEKAKERSGVRTDLRQTFATGESGRARDKAAEQFGISGEQARKTLYVADNADLLDPTDFADWDEGKLSTNKAFQKIKAAQRQAEQERDKARDEIDKRSIELDNARREIKELERQNDMLYEQVANAKTEVVTREVTREVAPKDYDDVKRRNRELEGSNRLYSDDNQKLRKKLEKTRKELDQAKALLGEKGRADSAQWDIEALTTATNNYLRQYGGKAWAFDQFYRVNEVTQSEFVKAINNLAAFATNLAQMIKEQPNE